MRKADAVRIRHMLDASLLAIKLVDQRSRADLDDEVMLRLSLVKLVEIVGEAAGQVTVAGRAGLPDVPWEDIVGTRHRLVHAYYDINLDILWQTVQQDLPRLAALLEAAIELSGELPAQP